MLNIYIECKGKYSLTKPAPGKSNYLSVTGTFSQTIPTHDAGLYVLGSGPTTEIAPVTSIERSARQAAEKVLFTTGNRCVIPAEFAGKTVRVSVFGLDGKMVNSVVTRNSSIRLYGNNSQGEKVGIVKITVVR